MVDRAGMAPVLGTLCEWGKPDKPEAPPRTSICRGLHLRTRSGSAVCPPGVRRSHRLGRRGPGSRSQLPEPGGVAIRRRAAAGPVRPDLETILGACSHSILHRHHRRNLRHDNVVGGVAGADHTGHMGRHPRSRSLSLSGSKGSDVSFCGALGGVAPARPSCLSFPRYQSTSLAAGTKQGRPAVLERFPAP